MIIIVALALLVASAFITRQLVRNSHRFSQMDIPNERSSHLTPTPRGGGIAFVTTSLVGFLLLLLNNSLDAAEILALCCAGAIVAIAGHLDDRQKISGAMVRLIFHALGAIILIVGIGFPSQISLFDRTVNTGVIGSILGVLYLVWLLNLFNFMDGTDGIAAIEAIFVCIAGAILNYHVLSDINLSTASIILATSTLGFLLYNWSPAKIFMGDSGSMIMGFLAALMTIYFLQANERTTGVLLLHIDAMVFAFAVLIIPVLDSVRVVFIRVFILKRSPFSADRNHIHHSLLDIGLKHSQATLALVLVNVFFILITYYLNDYLRAMYLLITISLLALAFSQVPFLIKNHQKKIGRKKVV